MFYDVNIACYQLTLALVSKSTLLNSILWIEHPINGASGSLCFSGKLFNRIELIFSNNFFFLVKEYTIPSRIFHKGECI